MASYLFANEIVLYVGYGLVGLVTFIVARAILKEEESRAVQEKLEETGEKNSGAGLLKITKPFFGQYVVPIIRNKAFWEKTRNKWKYKLISGGLKGQLNPDEFIAYKFFLVVFFPLVSGFLNSLDLMDVAWWGIILSSVAGWFYPDFWVNSRIAFRHKEIRKTLPFVVDLLALSTEAGSDFIGAMSRVVEKAAKGPLVDELETLLKEIKVGSSRADAMREMASRIGMTEVNSFVSILISADQMGAPIGKTLRQQSEAIRAQRFVVAEKAGALAAQKLLIPLVIFILPSVMLMIFGPLVLSFLSGEGTGF